MAASRRPSIHPTSARGTSRVFIRQPRRAPVHACHARRDATRRDARVVASIRRRRFVLTVHAARIRIASASASYPFSCIHVLECSFRMYTARTQRKCTTSPATCFVRRAHSKFLSGTAIRLTPTVSPLLGACCMIVYFQTHCNASQVH